jgi:hypothetical protein
MHMANLRGAVEEAGDRPTVVERDIRDTGLPAELTRSTDVVSHRAAEAVS